MKPIIQIALDFLELDRALKAAELAVKGGAEWIEAGTPLIKSEGLDAVRALRRKFPKHKIIADLKTMDAGRIEMEAAAKAGADIGIVMGAADIATITECIEAGENYGLQVCVDLLGVDDPIKIAEFAKEAGAHHVGIHLPIDAQMRGEDPLTLIKKVAGAVDIPIAAAGGINSESAADVVNAGAQIVIVGGAITKAEDPESATKNILKGINENIKIKTDLFKRGNESDILEILKKVSTPNICDAMHYRGAVYGIKPVVPNVKMVGQAFTVRTYPGDWAKPVEAISTAIPGQVLVVDAGGIPPAVWGELATESCIQKGIAGVVIYGAVRDVNNIRKLKYPVFSALITPVAGEPKGFGEMNVVLNINGSKIRPDDWIVGDDNGIVVVPKEKAVEYANRAMDWMERENRIRQEIRTQSSLSEVIQLEKWEKEIGNEI